ncbi:MAG TPA: DotU family type IV/VI secretion system protein [Pyrinomonadaceae bacterium]|jgi:type VI secretion system protein ImpK
MNEYGDSFLLGPFREFYREVIRLKRMVSTGTWSSPNEPSSAETPDEIKVKTGTWVYFPDIVSEAPDQSAEIAGGNASWTNATGGAPAWAKPVQVGNEATTALDYGEQIPSSDSIRMSNFVWQRLVSLFERQAMSAWRYGGTYGAEFYKEAAYVMAALADEIFLHTEWEGRKAWMSNLLETRIFQTHVAGELFFQRLDRLLGDRDPVYKDLAAVYLMALSLGFKGKYRGSDDLGQLARYREQLFSFIFRRDPDLENESRHLFPETYFHTLREESKKRLPSPRIWIGVLCLVIVCYLAVTHGIWVNLTSRLDQVNDRITVIVAELSKKR